MTETPTALIETSLGNITVQFFPEEAPEMVKNFTTLAKDEKYNDTIFHRVIKGFMIQGGDYTNFNGTGGASYTGKDLNDEISPNLSHVRGMLSMANRGPNTNGSQFFIVHKDAPHLDGGYSIFGQVTEGMDVVDAIAGVQTDLSDKPTEDVVLKSVTIQ